jgi:hypothetical protein
VARGAGRPCWCRDSNPRREQMRIQGFQSPSVLSGLTPNAFIHKKVRPGDHTDLFKWNLIA